MSKVLVYLANFPSENAEKGDEFKGSDTLKQSLIKRKVIGDGELSQDAAKANDKIAKLEEDATKANDKIAKLEEDATKANDKIAKLETMLESSVKLAINKKPDGYDEYLVNKGEE